MKESDLPVGIEIIDSEDINGVPCVELVIQCANKEIALDYFFNLAEYHKPITEFGERQQDA